MRKELIAAASVLALMTGTAYAQGAGNQLNMQQDNNSAVTSPTTGDTAAPPAAMGSDPAAPAAGTTAQAGSISVDELIGKNIVGADGETIGEVEDVIMDAASGQAHQLVVSSGGFLGIGAKQIAVDYSAVQPGTDNDELRLSNLTRDQVRDMPDFEYDDSMTSLNRSRDGAATGGATTTPAAPPAGTGTTTGQ